MNKNPDTTSARKKRQECPPEHRQANVNSTNFGVIKLQMFNSQLFASPVIPEFVNKKIWRFPFRLVTLS